MRKAMSLLAIFMVIVSCKEEAVKKPSRLIEKGVMVDIMYDLSLLEAIKYQNPNSVVTYKTNPANFIFRKYKIDSLQFAQNNVYYASNYSEYKDMFDQITKRIDREKAVADSLIKLEEKKKSKVGNAKLLKETLTTKDSAIKNRREFIKAKFAKKRLVKKDSLLIK